MPIGFRKSYHAEGRLIRSENGGAACWTPRTGSHRFRHPRPERLAEPKPTGRSGLRGDSAG